MRCMLWKATNEMIKITAVTVPMEANRALAELIRNPDDADTKALHVRKCMIS